MYLQETRRIGSPCCKKYRFCFCFCNVPIIFGTILSVGIFVYFIFRIIFKTSIEVSKIIFIMKTEFRNFAFGFFF
jgi:hypothetical protein